MKPARSTGSASVRRCRRSQPSATWPPSGERQAAPQAGVPLGMYSFMGFGGAARSRRRCSHARARRHFRYATAHPPFVAHVFWTVHGHRVLLPGTAASLFRVDPPAVPTGSARHPALPTNDLLAFAGLADKSKGSGAGFHEARDAPVRDSATVRQPAKGAYNIPTFHSSTAVEERRDTPREHGTRTDGIRTGPAHL